MSETCQADLMDVTHYGHEVGETPPCHEPREVERDGYWLCSGCDKALDEIIEITKRMGGFLRSPDA